MRFVAGSYEVQGTTLYVNRGFGTVGPPVARRGAARDHADRARRGLSGDHRCSANRPMRLAAIALLPTLACVPRRPARPSPRPTAIRRRAPHPDLEAARELDQQGVRAFRDARFADAIRFFRSAYRLGGPSSELWNIARSRERMDDAEAASTAIVQYLAQPDLGAQDRADAERELARCFAPGRRCSR